MLPGVLLESCQIAKAGFQQSQVWNSASPWHRNSINLNPIGRRRILCRSDAEVLAYKMIRSRGADPLALNHSYRMALTGSRWAARLAGSQQAKTPTEAKVKATARMTDGSERKPPFGIEAMR